MIERLGGAPALSVVAIGLTLLIGYGLVTAGTLDPLEPKRLRYGFFYGLQGDAILEGRLDVPCDVLRTEAFVVDGRCYGYFGITPSLLRLPLNALFPDERGGWASLLVLLASAAFLASAFGIVSLTRRMIEGDAPPTAAFGWLAPLFILGLGLGGTNVFLLSRPVVYHEATIFSTAMATGSVFFVLRFVSKGGWKPLAAAGVLSLASIQARPIAGLASAVIFGAAPLLRELALGGFALGQPLAPTLTRLGDIRIARRIAVGAAFGLLVIGSYVGVSYMKFDTLNGVPVALANNYDDARLENIEHSMFHLSNLRWNAASHFGLDGLTLRASFPFVGLDLATQQSITDSGRAAIAARYPEARIDGIEPHMGIPVGMPSLLLLAGVGLAACVLRPGQVGVLVFPILASLIGPVSLMAFVFLTYRYFHEYSLFFVLAGAVGVTVLAGGRSWRHMTGRALFVAATLWAVAANVYFALWYQLHDTHVGARLPEMAARLGAGAAFFD